MKNQFSFIIILLLLASMSSCKKDIDVCEGVEKKDVFSDVRSLDFSGHYFEKYRKPIIQDNFIYINTALQSNKEQILKFDMDKFELVNKIPGNLGGFHDNNYLFSRESIINGESYYIDLETLERKHVVINSNKTRYFIHNEIFNKDYVIYYIYKETSGTNKVYEIYKFIPNTSDPVLIGKFTIDKKKAEGMVIRSMKLWKSDNDNLLLSFSFSSYTTEVKEYISTYNISTNKLLFCNTLSLDKNGTDVFIKSPNTYYHDDKIIVSAYRGIILVYDINSGELLWKYFLNITDQDNFYLDKDASLVYAGQYDEIVSINLKTGEKEQILDLKNSKSWDIEYGSRHQLLMIPFENSIAYVKNKDKINTLELGTKIDLCKIDNINISDGFIKYIFNIKNSRKILLIKDSKIEVINYNL